MAPPRRPDPEPLETDDLLVVLVGTVLWLLALGLALVFRDRLDEHSRGSWLWVALAGTFLGLVGLRHVRRRRRALRESGESGRKDSANAGGPEIGDPDEV